MRVTVLLVGTALVLAGSGCLNSDPSGRYARVQWGHSFTQCSNGVCTYANNAEELASKVRCGTAANLTWTVKEWVHGAVTLHVYDSSGAEKDMRVLSSNGHGEKPLTGGEGVWRLEGTTRDANGQLDARLTCQ
ncbi:MAG TPA: hypothetical protein VI818_02990 [Candidatus Thermoplasmatota archaeon]|nr:hypothetical protein [Candidatus Thermoplasmatota archaeon]